MGRHDFALTNSEIYLSPPRRLKNTNIFMSTQVIYILSGTHDLNDKILIPSGGHTRRNNYM